MTISLNHTIVHARNPEATSKFLVHLLDLPAARRLGHFTVVQIGETSLDYIQTDEPIASRHFAFRISEAEFDATFERIVQAGIQFWADPFQMLPDEINRWDDGRGLYFLDPDGHLLEVLTRSYGSGGLGAKHPNPLLAPPT